jgi:hypothetical protein
MLTFRRNGTAALDADGNARAPVVHVWEESRGPPTELNSYVALVDPAGHVLAIRSDDPMKASQSAWTFDYGPRATFAAPTEIRDRVPAPFKLTWRTGPSGGKETWLSVAETVGDFGIPREELTLHVTRGAAEIAQFRLDADMTQNGLSFSFVDRDQDGLASFEDRLVVTGSALDELTFRLHDDWAGRDVGKNPYRIPVGGWIPLLALAGALAVCLRRR